ncbi:MAG TPA: hypothetical protein VFV52_16570 [Bacilli bacterium]|nr:hypothetical protein [Bacilli bacterium]
MKTFGRKAGNALLAALFGPLWILAVELIEQGDNMIDVLLLGVAYLWSLPFVFVVGLPTSYLIDRLTAKRGRRLWLYAVAGCVEGSLLTVFFARSILSTWTLTDFLFNPFFVFTFGCSLTFGVLDNEFLRHRRENKIDLPQ